MQDFKVGEKVVYPAHGVGIIENIHSRTVAGDEARFYTLRIVDSDMTIMIPLARAIEVGLRHVMGKDMVTKVYRVLREKRVEVDQATWNRRYREYTEKIKTGSVFEVAEVLRDLYLLRNDKTLSFGERRMLDMAKRLLVQELSVAKKVGEDVVEEELEDIFKPTNSSTS